jgi:hypothetical protein
MAAISPSKHPLENEVANTGKDEDTPDLISRVRYSTRPITISSLFLSLAANYKYMTHYMDEKNRTHIMLSRADWHRQRKTYLKVKV